MYEDDMNRESELNQNVNPEGSDKEIQGTDFVMSEADQEARQEVYQGTAQSADGFTASAPQNQNYQNYQSCQSQPSQGEQTYNWQPQENIILNGQPDNTRYVEPGTDEKKKNHYGRRAAGIIVAALLFGVVAGGTMVGVNMIARSFTAEEETYPQVGTQEPVTVPATTLPSSSGGSTASTAVLLDVSDIVKSAMPSVVAINNTITYRSSDWFGRSQTYEVPGTASGIIIGQNEGELLIATNNHVVEDAENFEVVFIDDTSVPAAVKGTDEESDLAIVAVQLKDIPEDTFSQIKIAKLGNSDELEPGQGVIAIGNALGYGQSVTVGYISAVDREMTVEDSVTRTLLQTDAAINPGNSGGPLLNMKGEVIGINESKLSGSSVEGMGYAIPISRVEDILEDLMSARTKTEEVPEGEEGYLGIQGLTVDDTLMSQLDMPAGVFVYSIIEGSAADNSDLRPRDIITKFDGQTVKTMASLQQLLKYYRAGETVEMTVMSVENGEYVERTFDITLGERSTLGQDAEEE